MQAEHSRRAMAYAQRLQQVCTSLHLAIIVQLLTVHWLTVSGHSLPGCCGSQEGALVQYPGLQSHAQHHLIEKLRNNDYGYGGILTLDLGSQKVDCLSFVVWVSACFSHAWRASVALMALSNVWVACAQAAEQFMERAQNKHAFGLLAVSLGYFETLLSMSGSTTSSELTEEEQKVAGEHCAFPCSPGCPVVSKLRAVIGY